MLRVFGVAWGLFGVVLLLAYAIWRLSKHTIEAWAMPWSWLVWLVFIVSVIFMAYSEGYRGFQKAFSPRVAARLKHLYEQPQLLRVLLAPAFAMGFFHATKRRMITSYAVFFGILALVLLFRLLPQPWRGVLDGAVVVGLTWGLIATLIACWNAFTDHAFNHPHEVPST